MLRSVSGHVPEIPVGLLTLRVILPSEKLSRVARLFEEEEACLSSFPFKHTPVSIASGNAELFRNYHISVNASEVVKESSPDMSNSIPYRWEVSKYTPTCRH
ncbi:hypothetical protein NPIL_235681 [Nephila pilipes]|uniref:Uncharacterized protein n=1 Tax=Nephila pilipes TaxID=299642 RepID=A0A8X6KR06_NEPPI|nr:hypothetical protein NPIL_235681 [Nephila pilipes]